MCLETPNHYTTGELCSTKLLGFPFVHFDALQTFLTAIDDDIDGVKTTGLTLGIRALL